jgi:hyperosmotically inducible periplasmic protein
MFKLISTSLLVAAICLILGACTTNNMNTSNSNSGGLKAKISDSDLKTNVKAKLDSDAQVRAANLTVDADAATNQVTLSGTVDSQGVRTKAIDLAKNAQTGLMVTDKINVKSGEMSRTDYTEDLAKQARDKAKAAGDKIGETLDDAWIHTKIVAKLITNSNTPERKINVDVVNNVVTLRGTVDTAAQKTEAEMVAKNTDGVKSVSNQLKVGNTMAKTEPTKK